MRTLFRSRWRWIGLALAGLALLVLIGTNNPRTIRGQVLDAQTRQPIAGAVALGVWHRIAGLPGLHHGELVGVKEVETDAEGRFVLPRPFSLRIDEEAITVYKFGYVAWSNLYIFPYSLTRMSSKVPSRIIIEPFPPGQSVERHVHFVHGAIRSGYGRESAPKFWEEFGREEERAARFRGSGSPTASAHPEAEWLPTLEMKRLFEEYKDILSHGSVQRRRKVAADLEVFGQPAVPVLLSALRDRDDDVRSWAARSLGRVRPPATLPLAQALRDGDVRVRLGAVDALQGIGPLAQEALPDLANALHDADWLVAYTAANVLSKIGAPAAPILLEALGDPDPLIRRRAASALGSMTPPVPEAVPALIRTLQDPDGKVRWASARALGTVGPAAAEALPPLIHALKDLDAEVRAAVPDALGRIRPPAAVVVGPLAEALKDSDAKVRASAAETFARFAYGTNEAIPLLRAALKDPDPLVRRHAAEGLEKITPQEAQALPTLIEAMKEVHGAKGSRAAAALVQIGAPAVPGLIQLLGHENVNVRIRAAQTLYQLGTEGVEATQALVGRLKDSEPGERASAAEALGSVRPKSPEVISALRQLWISDPEAEVRAKAEWALRQIELR